MRRKKDAKRGLQGFTLVEALVVTALLTLLGFAVLKSSIAMLRSLRMDKHRLAALNFVQQQFESLRGMDYYRIGIRGDDNVGFMNQVVVENDSYDVTADMLMSNIVVLSDMGTESVSDDVNATMITYVWDVDDAWDLSGENDLGGGSNDYKRVRVEVTWEDQGVRSSQADETIIYGIVADDLEYETDGGGGDTGVPVDNNDPAEVEIVMAEYKLGKSELKVEAVSTEPGSPGLFVEGYGVMRLDKGKYVYSANPVPDPGASIRVTSDAGGSDAHPVKVSK